jgi:uncharacterized protein (DUF169 family)
MLVYPYVTGQMNFTVTGFGFGMKARQLFPEGMIILSLPWDLLPEITRNLQEIDWVPHSFTIGRDAHKAKVRKIADNLKKKLPAIK